MNLKVGVVVVYSIEDKTDPKFAVLVKLFLADGNILLGLKKMDVVQYSNHYHSWIAETTSQRMYGNFRNDITL